MPELEITRHNALVDPTLHVWSWEIPVYLFLGGCVAGLMILAGLHLLRAGVGARHWRSAARVLPLAAMGLLSAGMLALFLDLGHKLFTWRLYTTFQMTSPMSWGAWILLLVYATLACAAVVDPPRWLLRTSPAAGRAAALLRARPSWRSTLAGALILLGTALGIYTGVLLSALGARPLWSSALLGPLFLVSGLSSAAAFLHFMAGSPDERAWLSRADALLLALELVVIALLVIGLANGSAAQAHAAALLLGGPFTAVFWVIAVGLGILLPLVIQLVSSAGRAGHTVVAPVLVLAGSLALRFVIVHAGQFSRWQ